MEFTDFELDILSEIGNVSVGGAATSLSDFVNKIVTITIPKIAFRSFKEIKNDFEPSAIAARIDYVEGFSGSNILLIKKEDALACSIIVAKEKLGMEPVAWDEWTQNILEEIFNIMVGTMSSQMSIIFDRKVLIDPPQLYEKQPSDLDFYEDDEVLCEIRFELNINGKMKLKLMNLMSKSQAAMMIDIIKGIHHM